ncbi:hypothetical protein C3L33_12587, partial [Rhododendron williamsianum]
MDSDQGKLFIGGISWETDEGKLSDYFGNYGDVLQTVVMRDKITGRPRGFGFVVFADLSVLDRVLQEKHTIDGRTVEAKRAMSRDEHQSASRAGNGSSARNLEYFESYGNVTDVVVMYDQATQRPRGFGFVSFDSEEAVDRVLHKTYHDLNGKQVEVKRALPKDANPGGGGRSMGGGGAGGRRRYMQSQNAGGGFPAYGSSGYSASGYGYGPANNSMGYGGYGAAGYGNASAWGGSATGGPGSAPTGQSPGGASGYGNQGYGYGGYGGSDGSYANQAAYGAVGGRAGSVPSSNVLPVGERCKAVVGPTGEAVVMVMPMGLQGMEIKDGMILLKHLEVMELKQMGLMAGQLDMVVGMAVPQLDRLNSSDFDDLIVSGTWGPFLLQGHAVNALPVVGFGSSRKIRRYVDDSVVLGFFPFGGEMLEFRSGVKCPLIDEHELHSGNVLFVEEDLELDG